MRFFSYDSKFSQILLKLCYSCYLNLLWLICSLPVFTIGASTTALYYVSLKLIRGEEKTLIAPMFFKSFRENFKQATVIWLIMLAAGSVLGADGYILYHLRRTSTGSLGILLTIALALIIAAAILYTIILLFIFPLTASVTNTTRAMFKNAFLIGTHYLFATITVFAVHFAMFYAVVALFTPLAVFGEGLCALLSSWLLNNILISVTSAPEDED